MNVLLVLLCDFVFAFAVADNTRAPFDIKDCRHLYLDIGSNIGVQVRKLFEPEKYPNAPFEAIFEKNYGPVALRREYVCAIGFEPNPRKAAHLLRLQNCYNNWGWRTWFLTETVFGIKNGQTAFFSDNDTANEEWGASIYDHTSQNIKVIVQEVDAADFLLQYAQPVSQSGGAVIAKMDIEGSEFLVLPHLLANKVMGVDLNDSKDDL
jgi:hypothetical protein